MIAPRAEVDDGDSDASWMGLASTGGGFSMAPNGGRRKETLAFKRVCRSDSHHLRSADAAPPVRTAATRPPPRAFLGRRARRVDGARAPGHSPRNGHRRS